MAMTVRSSVSGVNGFFVGSLCGRRFLAMGLSEVGEHIDLNALYSCILRSMCQAGRMLRRRARGRSVREDGETAESLTPPEPAAPPALLAPPGVRRDARTAGSARAA